MKLAARDDRQLGLELTEIPRKKRAGVLLSFYPQGQPIPVPEVLEREMAAASQEALILEWFRQRPSRTWAPSDLETSFPGWHITSIRARISTLEKKGFLVHHGRDRRDGPRGAKESRWSLAAQNLDNEERC